MKTALFAFVGAYLIAITAWRYFARGTADGAFYMLLVGAASLLVMGYRKAIYVTPVGVVKETRTLFSNHSEILRWEEVRFTSIMYRGDSALVLLERDVLGWKVLFQKEQIPRLKELFQHYIPDIETDER